MKRIMSGVNVALILFAAASSTWSAGPSNIRQTTEAGGAIELSNLAEDSPNEGIAEQQSATVGESSAPNVSRDRTTRVNERTNPPVRGTAEVAVDAEKKKELDNSADADTTSMPAGSNYGITTINSGTQAPVVPIARGVPNTPALPNVPMPLAADYQGRLPSPTDQMTGHGVPNALTLPNVPTSIPMAADSQGQLPSPVNQSGVGPNPRPGTDMAVPSKVELASSTLQERYRDRMLELASGQASGTSAVQENPAVIRRYLMVDRGTYQSRSGR